jgi:hypothetical protein
MALVVIKQYHGFSYDVQVLWVGVLPGSIDAAVLLQESTFHLDPKAYIPVKFKSLSYLNELEKTFIMTS